jgi:hypothetical protein
MFRIYERESSATSSEYAAYQEKMTLHQADKQCVFSGESLCKQIMRANCSLCAECCYIADLCETNDQERWAYSNIRGSFVKERWLSRK